MQNLKKSMGGTHKALQNMIVFLNFVRLLVYLIAGFIIA